MGNKISPVAPVAGQVYDFRAIPNHRKLYSELRIFPTPFKGIYYVPYETERNSWYVTDPLKVIFMACHYYLGGDDYYYGLGTALYYLNVKWQCPEAHVMNPAISRRVSRKLPAQSYWRGRAVGKIMQCYPQTIQFHRMAGFSMNGVVRRGLVSYSNEKKTRADADYLAKRKK